MATYIGKGTKLYVENRTTPGQFDLLCFIELTQPEPEVGEIETTDSCTPGIEREFEPTLIDNGTFSGVMKFDDDAAEKAKVDDLRVSFKAREIRKFRVDHEQTMPGQRQEFDGFFKKFIGPKFDGFEENLKVMFDLRVTGSVLDSDI